MLTLLTTRHAQKDLAACADLSNIFSYVLTENILSAQTKHPYELPRVLRWYFNNLLSIQISHLYS